MDVSKEFLFKTFEMTDEEYERIHDADVEAVAAARGCYVWNSDDNILQLDIDSREDLDFAVMQIQRMKAHGEIGVLDMQVLESQNGNWHVVVWMDTALAVPERIALQASMGSDRVREMLNLSRFYKGVRNPIRLFRPEGTPVPTRRGVAVRRAGRTG